LSPRQRVIPGHRLIQTQGQVRLVLARVAEDIAWLAREAPEIGLPLQETLAAIVRSPAAADLLQDPPPAAAGGPEAEQAT